MTSPGRLDGGDSGATAVEYALMVSFITVAVMGTVAALGLGVQGLFTLPGW